jgi:hypothetical protein
MAANKIFNFGPVALTTTLTTNILNPNITSVAGPVGFTMTQPYIVLKHIRIVNKTGSAATASLWKGATGGNAAGTEVVVQGTSIPANSYLDWYGIMRFDAADFLVGGSGTATALSIQGEGEIGVSG